MKLSQFIEKCQHLIDMYGDGDVYSLDEFGTCMIPTIHQH